MSYLNATTTQPPRGYTSRNKDKSGPVASAKIPIGRESPSAYKRRSPLNSIGQSPHSSPRPSVSSTQSITPEPPKVRGGGGGGGGGGGSDGRKRGGSGKRRKKRRR